MITSPRPRSVNILRFILIFRLAIIAIVIITFFFVKDSYPTERSMSYGFRLAIEKAFGIDETDSTVALGFLIGILLIPILILTFILFAIKRRKFGLAVGLSIVDIVFGFGRGGLPILAIVCLVLILTNPTKNYLKQQDYIPSVDEDEPLDGGNLMP